MKFADIIARAREIRAKYDEQNARENGGAWGSSELMAGLVGDVGDLSKLVMAKNGKRTIADVDSKLAHEMADCLWAIICLADAVGVDLEKSFGETMNELDKRF